jgi:hypothetical protein
VKGYFPVEVKMRNLPYLIDNITEEYFVAPEDSETFGKYGIIKGAQYFTLYPQQVFLEKMAITDNSIPRLQDMVLDAIEKLPDNQKEKNKLQLTKM